MYFWTDRILFYMPKFIRRTSINKGEHLIAVVSDWFKLNKLCLQIEIHHNFPLRRNKKEFLLFISYPGVFDVVIIKFMKYTIERIYLVVR